MKKVVMITGGTRGIGLASAKRFLQEQAIVIAASLDSREIVQRAMSELKTIGEAEYHYLDVADEKSCIHLVNNVINRYKRVDVLVNAAGVRGKPSLPLDTDFRDFKRTMETNLMGTVRMATIVAGHMKEQGSGTIINISSISGSLFTADVFG